MPPPRPPAAKRKWGVIVAVLLLIGLAVTACLVAGGIFLLRAVKQRAEAVTAHKEIGKAVDTMVDDTIVSLEQGDIDSNAKRLDEFAGLLGKAAEKGTPSDRAQMLAAQRILQWIGEPLPAYQEAVRALETSRFPAPGSLSSREHIAEVRDIAKRFRSANHDLESRMSGIEAKLREELSNTPISAAVREKFIQDFLRSSNRELNLEIRATDTKIADSVDAMLDVLEQEWGKWSASEQEGYLFETPAAQEKFAAATEAMNQAAVEQQAVQQRLVENLRSRQGTRKPADPEQP
jgi:RNA-splicing ligase RtcB